MGDLRRLIPRTDNLLSESEFAEAIRRLGRERVKMAVRTAQQRARDGFIDPGQVRTAALAELPPGGLRRVLNATGVLLHTNLGRAPLSASAIRAIVVAAGVTDLELNLVTGRRGRRGRTALAALATAVPAAEDVHVVNNNAAALVLTATALAQGGEIVVSRGELVEIGDGFRLPELLASTGARLREVGTTNRTSVQDYADTIGPETAFVLKVHPSNYRIEGFAETPGVKKLAEMCRLAKVPLVADVGSGLLRPEPVLPDEPDAATWLTEGADLVTASGDKLLGGPQCGLLLGRADLIEQLRRHPLARALRADKLTLAALEATLISTSHPTSAMLHANFAGLLARAQTLAVRLAEAGVQAQIVRSTATVGGGGAPGIGLASVALVLDESLAVPLREGNLPVLGRVERGRCLLDLRAVPPNDDEDLFDAVVSACK